MEHNSIYAKSFRLDDGTAIAVIATRREPTYEELQRAGANCQAATVMRNFEQSVNRGLAMSVLRKLDFDHCIRKVGRTVNLNLDLLVDMTIASGAADESDES